MAKSKKLTEEDFPEPGTVFIAPIPDGRLAAGRVLRRQFEGGAMGALVAASRWVGSAIPSIETPELREPLVLTHHKWKGEPELFWAHDPMPPEFTILGRLDLSAEDLAVVSYTFGGWWSVPGQALTQWRWDHDREALLSEEAAEKAEELERRQKAAAARAEFMRTLTLESLAERSWLPGWDDGLEGTKKSRELLASLVSELRAQPRLTKGVVKRLVKQSVLAVNRLDAESQFVSTIEREDLCEAYEQIACAAGFPEVSDEVDRAREW